MIWRMSSFGKKLWLALGALVVGAWCAPAQEMQVQAVCATTAYEVGKPFDVALQAQIPAPWHAYYRNPGTVGLPMTASLQAPEHFTVEGPFWSAPTLHSSEVGTAYVYEKPVVVWRVTPQTGAEGSARFVISAEAQLCSDEGCMPPQAAEAALELPQGTPAANPAWPAAEQLVESLSDTPLQALSAVRTEQGATLRFQKAGDAAGAYFFSDDNAVAPAAAQPLTRAGDGTWQLALTRNDGQDMMYPAPEENPGPLQRLAGTLTFADGGHARVDVSVAAATAAAPAAASHAAPPGLWAAVGGLFLGGLLLNFMPCVFPVLGLKIMSFVQMSGDSRGRVVAHALAFVAGILISFWLLGLALVAVWNAEALAAADWQDWAAILWGDGGATDRTWAAWMQEPWVVYGILLLLLVLGMSMYGVFEIGTRATGIGSGLQQKSGMVGSFFQGFLITVVATPCSAPFLGQAIAVVMAFPAVWMLTALTGMALGLALPYLLLSLFPSLVGVLPRPGAWMESLKQGLAFLMFAAAAWMLYVYLPFLSGDSLVPLVSLVVFCSAFWVYGRWCPLYRSYLSRYVGGCVALALAALGVWGSMPQPPATHEWQEWSPAAMQSALEQGKPVYVDFTAKWCVTCQSNKKIAYTEDVYKLFADKHVVLMRADKTKPNAEIDAEMRRLNRSAVPTNALYTPGAPPAVTTELLTPSYLKDFLNTHLK